MTKAATQLNSQPITYSEDLLRWGSVLRNATISNNTVQYENLNTSRLSTMRITRCTRALCLLLYVCPKSVSNCESLSWAEMREWGFANTQPNSLLRRQASLQIAGPLCRVDGGLHVSGVECKICNVDASEGKRRARYQLFKTRQGIVNY